MKPSLVTHSVIAGMLAFASGAAFAAEDSLLAQRARSGEGRQTLILGSSQKITAELASMVDEYERNGLQGDDVRSLKSLQILFTKISDKDMAKILVGLQEAGASNDPKAALKAMVNAYSNGKGVLSQLNGILAEFARNSEALELSNEVKKLSDRQAANLQSAIEVARFSLLGGKDAEAAVEASLQAQGVEQKAINEDLSAVSKKIDDFAKKPGNTALADRFKKGLGEIAKVKPALEAAETALAQKKSFEAVANEKTARDQLRQAARTITPPRENSQALREAADQIDKLIAQQKSMIVATESSTAKPYEVFIAEESKITKGEFYQLLKKKNWLDTPLDKLLTQESVHHYYQGKKEAKQSRSVGLENQQGDLVNQSDALSRDLEKIAQQTAEALKAAIAPMQVARAALLDKAPDNALKPEKDALGWMEKAKTALEQRIAVAEKAESGAKDSIAEMKQMQQEAQSLLAQQQEIANETALPKNPQQNAVTAQKQSDLEKKAAQLQQKSKANSADAAQSLDKASTAMQKAADAMSKPPQATAPAVAQMQALQAQAQAVKELKKASEQLGQQIGKMDQVKAALDNAEKGIEDLAKIIDAEQKLQSETVQAVPQKKLDVIKALAPRQEGIQQSTDAFRKTLTLTAVPAPQPNGEQSAKSLADASLYMGNARGSLTKGDGEAAEPEEKKAIAELFAIKNTLQAQAKAAAKQLGTETKADAKAAEANIAAAAAITKAQEQLDKANAIAAQNQAANDPAKAGDKPDGAKDPAAQNQAANDPKKGGDKPDGAKDPAAQNQAANDPKKGGDKPDGAKDPAAQDQAGNDQKKGGDKPDGAKDATAKALADAAKDIAKAAVDAPPGVGEAMAAAAAALAKTGAETGAGQDSKAKASGAEAQKALDKAAAAIAQAEAGIQPNQPGQPGEPGKPGEAGKPGQPGEQAGKPGEPGKPDKPGEQGDGKEGNKQITGASQGSDATLAATNAQFMKLPVRIRTAILQGQKEGSPQQYASRVEQYMQNLADETIHR